MNTLLQILNNPLVIFLCFCGVVIGCCWSCSLADGRPVMTMRGSDNPIDGFFGKGASQGPSPHYSIFNDSKTETSISRPFGKRQAESIEGISFVPASVALLLDSRGPSAVLLGVWSVIVDPLHRKFWIRSFSHVGKESPEIMPPFIADRNAPSAVARITGGCLAVTSMLHLEPDIIF